MTNNELNRDVKRLFKEVFHTDETKEYNENAYKFEFLRLYHADSSFSVMNRKNILRMLRLNLRLRAVQLHFFGLHIDEHKLK